MRALLVKMSSLGDVVHAFPALTDAAAHGVRVDWVVEEAYAGIAGRHPAVDRVIPIGWRRWREDLRASRGQLREFVRRLRESEYDLVLDAQGLIKSAVVTALARGPKCGLAAHSARESWSALFYAQRVTVPREWHAIDRLRALFAGAFGYAVPAGEDFGIHAEATPQPLCVLLHGTTWPTKQWPEFMWVALAQQARAHGLRVAIPWGDAAERARAERIASAASAEVWDRVDLTETADRLSAAALVVGVDSGMSHLSAALGIPTVVLYGATSSALTGCRGPRAVSLQADFPCAPCLARSCAYAGEQVHWQGESVRPACYSRLAPERVWQVAADLMNANRVLSL